MRTIITDSTEIGEFLSDMNVGLDFDVIKSDLWRAEKKWLKNVLGAELLELLRDEFVDQDESSTSTSGSSSTGGSYSEEQFNDLKALCQHALCFLGTSLYINRGFAKIVNNRIEHGAGEGEALNYYERQELAQEYLENGLELIDDIYAYLESNRTAFTVWTSSTAYTLYHKYFVQSCATFEQAVNIGNSRRTFKLLALEFEYLENITLPNSLTIELIDELRVEIKKTEPSEYHSKAVGYLQKHLSHAATVRLMDAQRVKIDSNAIVQIETAGDHIDKKYQATRSDISIKKSFHSTAAEQWMKKLKDYLNENADQFENWTAPTDTTSTSTFLNPTGKTIGL